MKKVLLTVLGAVLLANVAGASVILNLVGGAPTAGTLGYTGDFVWTYYVTLSNDQNFVPGDYTEVVDFSGYVPGSAKWQPNVSNVPTGAFTITTQSIGPGLAAVDTPTLNIVVTDNSPGGATVLGKNVGGQCSTTDTSGCGNLGQIVAVSTLGGIAMSGGQVTGLFSSVAQNALSQLNTGNQGSLPTPGPVPEPTTFSLIGAALLAAGFVGRRRVKKG